MDWVSFTGIGLATCDIYRDHLFIIAIFTIQDAHAMLESLIWSYLPLVVGIILALIFLAAVMLRVTKPALSALLVAFIVVTGLASLSRAAAGSTEIWLDIDTKASSLTVMQGQTRAIVFQNIAIGSNGASWNRQLNDEQTPLGDFTITEVRSSKRFDLFMLINYPNKDHARRAFENGRITAAEHDTLMKAFNRGGPPPQNTSLGGHLGIHGLGAGNLEVHQRFNWTDGCIALTNEQVEELAQWVNPGTRVLIH
jgi:hypothetical protein